MSFLPANLDQQAASLQSSLMTAELPAQVQVPRSFSDPSYLMEINDLRAKVRDKTATKEDMKRVIALIRETRGAVTTTAATTKAKRASSAKPKTAKPDGQALLDML